ncbi:MAG: hypothetical protein ABW221_00535 [Vicinamibacteria bacterium]
MTLMLVIALAAASPAPAAPYSVPWLMRPAAPGNGVRVDETLAFDVPPGAPGTTATAVTSLTASWRPARRWAFVARQSFVRRDPSGAAAGDAFSNPLLGANRLWTAGARWRGHFFAASTVPIGSGGGDAPSAAAAAALTAAVPARSGMDNALFAVNYWTAIAGAGAARVTPALTVQAEVTVLQLNRVRGARTQDGHRTNLTAGLHVGRFVTPRLSIGAEARMQRWLTDAAPVRADASARQQFTVGAGPRLHLKIGSRWLRPGLSYSRALDAPMKRRGYDILQIDVPVSF